MIKFHRQKLIKAAAGQDLLEKASMNQLEEIKVLTIGLESLQSKHQELSAVNINLEDALLKSSDEMDGLKSHCTTLCEQITQLTFKNAKLSSSLNRLKMEFSEQSAAHKQEFNKLVHQLDHLQTDQDRIMQTDQDRINALNQEIESLNDSYARRQKTYSEQVKDLTHKNSLLQHVIVKSNAKIQDLHSLLQQKDNRVEQIKRLESRISATESTWKQRITLMENKCNKWTSHVALANQKIKDLKAESKSTSKSLANSIISLNNSLEQINLLKSENKILSDSIDQLNQEKDCLSARIHQLIKERE